jgi:uncharacterized protein (TIGR01777 family)
MNVLIAGGSGFLGKALATRLLEAGHTVSILSRNPSATRQSFPDRVAVEQWDARTVGSWIRLVEGADAVVNLTGESIGAKRWTQTQKERILSSRIDSTRAIVEALRQASRRPRVLVNQSAVGYYGNVPFVPVEEDHPPGNDFLAHVAVQWETEARKATDLGVRVVIPRTGVVLSAQGGALPRLLPPFRFFIGGPLGSGSQWFPWIHLDDEIGAMMFVVEKETIEGAVNFAAPGSVTMKEFCAALGKVLHRPSWAPVPGFVLKLILGEMAGPLLLQGQRVVPRKLLDAGYAFRFPTVYEALQDILK